MVGEWKKQAMEGLAAVFSDRSVAQEAAKSSQAEVEKLHAKIGQLLVEPGFLAKAFGVDECRTGGDRDRTPTILGYRLRASVSQVSISRSGPSTTQPAGS